MIKAIKDAIALFGAMIASRQKEAHVADVGISRGWIDRSALL